MSKLLKQVQMATELGGKRLDQFVSVAEMTSEQFKQAFEQDAIGALSAFIDGLNDTERNGMSTIAVLDEMGLTEVRLSNTILSLANASSVMTDAINIANEGWNENSALTHIANIVGGIASVFSEAIPEIKRFDDTVSKTTQEAVGSFMDLDEKATISLNQMAWSGAIVTEEMKNNITSTIDQMKEQVVSKIDEQKNETTQLLTEQLATLTTLTEEEKQKIITDANAEFDEKKKITEEGIARINEILSNASQQNRALTEDEANEINSIKQQMMNTAVSVMSETEAEQAAILERMKANASDLSAQQAAEVVRNSIEQKDKTIEAANQEYDERMKVAARLRAIGTAESEKAADEIIASAEKQKTETIAKAEEMHQKVVLEAQKQADEHINQVNWETGEIKSNWEVFWQDVGTNISNGWNNVKTWFSDGIENIKASWSEGLENVKQNASQSWDEIVQGANTLKENAVSKITELKEGIQNKWRRAKRKYNSSMG